MLKHSNRKTYTVDGEKHTLIIDQMMHDSWIPYLKPLLNSEYFAELTKLIKDIYSDKDLVDLIEPATPEDIFSPLLNTNINDIKVIILGGSPKNLSNGLLYGSDFFDIKAYNEDLIKHTEYFKSVNPDFLLDTSLMDYVDNGILPLNMCPLAVKSKDLFFLSSFRQYISNIIYAVMQVNPKVIVATTHAGGISIVRAASLPTNQLIVSEGYFKVRNSDGQNIYEAINEKLEEPIEFWK